MLQGKKIILGVTGSIAAYKAAVLLRLLVKEGAEVKVLMTDLAKEFVTPLTFATLSKNPVLTEFYNPENGDWNSHVDLGLWADLFIIAPATANTMAKMASGIADNILLTTYLSIRCKVMVAPAMDLDMFLHPATQQNIEKLRSFGNTILEPSTGELASGLSGKGRMEEPEAILEQVNGIFQKKKLKNKKILITAGPTYEHIDPVRFIGNHSSGKMGFAIAESAVEQGARVKIISGPVQVASSNPNIEIIDVVSAKQMHDEALKHFENHDVTILCAAVADYTPQLVSKTKIKRKGDLSIQLKPTIDIAKKLGKKKREDQILIGFALETNDERENALKKLKNKNLDFIVLNSLKIKGAGFKTDTNKVTIIDKSGEELDFDLKSKSDVAKDIIDKLITYYEK